MLTMRRATIAAIAGAAAVLLILPAAASDTGWRRHSEYRFFGRDRLSDRKDGFVGFSVDGLPTRLPGGTYVGAIAAVRDRGNGNYFAIRNLGPAVAVDHGAAKVIHVTPETARAACHDDHGVCVIRP